MGVLVGVVPFRSSNMLPLSLSCTISEFEPNVWLWTPDNTPSWITAFRSWTHGFSPNFPFHRLGLWEEQGEYFEPPPPRKLGVQLAFSIPLFERQALNAAGAMLPGDLVLRTAVSLALLVAGSLIVLYRAKSRP